jgi:predicted nicotinamide N-methyase
MPRFTHLVFIQAILLRKNTSLGFVSRQNFQQRTFFASSKLYQSASTEVDILHTVNGIICREVNIDIKKVGGIKILEATAESQDELVEIACATEEEIAQFQNEPLIKSGDPYGAVLWPAASAVSDYLTTIVSEEFPSRSLKGLTILELGTGTGLCALSAALGGATRVIATDYEEIPLRLLEYAVEHVNCDDGNGEIDRDARRLRLASIETGIFDICKHDVPLPKADIVIAADIMYEPMTGIATAIRAVEALNAGSRVIIGCSPGRPGRPYFTDKLKQLLPNVNTEFREVEGRTCSGPRNELICGENSHSVSAEPKPLNVALIDLKPEQSLF